MQTTRATMIGHVGCCSRRDWLFPRGDYSWHGTTPGTGLLLARDTGLLCWSLDTAMRSFQTFSMALGARQALHALISFSCLPSTLAPYAYEVFLTNIFQASVGHTLGSEHRIFKITIISLTDLILTTAMLIHSPASLQVLNN